MKSTKSSSFLLLCLAVLSTDAQTQYNSYGNYCLKGSMMLWYGYKSYIPHGWVICDGYNGTPNMKGKFARGYTKYDGDVLGECNGDNSFTINVGNLPPHDHGGTTTQAEDHSHGHDFTFNEIAAHSHGVTTTTTDGETSAEHTHVIPSLSILSSGAHDHEIIVFYPPDEGTPGSDRIDDIRMDCVDDNELPTNLPKTENDGAHIHSTEASQTPSPDSGSQHSHSASGTAASGNAHTPSFSGGGVTGEDGVLSVGARHEHKIPSTGQGNPIEHVPAYVALYYICCTDYYDPWARKSAQPVDGTATA